MGKTTFAPGARAFLTEARGAGNPYASAALGELDRLEALVRAVRRHWSGNTTRRLGPSCHCSGPRECLLEIVECAERIGDPK